MIRLKNLLVEENSLAKTDGTNSSKPNVLFIGDSTIKRPWSYAQRLLSYNTVEGDVVSIRKPKSVDLLRLMRTSINDKYNIISISFFGLDKTELEQQNLTKLVRTYSDILEIAKSNGAKVIVVPPSESELPSGLYKWLVSQDMSDSVIETNIQETDVRRLNTKVYYKWVDTANNLLDIKLAAVSGDETEKLETKPDKPLGDVLKTSNQPKSLNGKKPVSVNTNKGTGSKSIIQPTNIINANFSDSAENQAYDIILPFEGFNATPQIDLFTDKHGVVHGDGFCRIGHGCSHITQADGKVINLGKPAAGKSCEETYPYTIELEDAHRDLRRLISKTFKPYVIDKIRSWGGDASKFNDATIAVLISVVYNYGHMPEKLKDGIASSDMIAIATALKTNFTNSKSNPKRRKKEGDYILSSLSSNSGDVVKSANDSPSLFKQAWNSVKGVLGLNNIEPIVPKPYTGKLGYTSGFGPRWGKFHYGVDFSLGVGTPIYIVIPGEIIRADGRNATGYGNVIYVKHEDGVVTRYGHMSRMDVSVGQRVEKGDLIGLTGGKKGAPGAGNSTGPHLHWEYHVNGKAVNGINEAEKYFSTKPVKIEQQPIELPSLNV